MLYMEATGQNTYTRNGLYTGASMSLQGKNGEACPKTGCVVSAKDAKIAKEKADKEWAEKYAKMTPAEKIVADKEAAAAKVKAAEEA